MGEIMLTIQLRNGKLITNKFYVVKNITNYCPRSISTNWDTMKHLLADENYNKPGKVQALLGVGIWIQVIESGVIRSANKQAVAHKTKLGYVILENEENSFIDTNPFIGSINKGVSMKQLMSQIQKLWEIEEIPTIKKRSKEEELCEQVFVKTHTRNKHGRYIVRMPLTDKIKTLGKSKNIALKQFFGMERRMKRDDGFASKYRNFMSEYETLGHMEEIWEDRESGYYIPHHGVITAEKFRVVFNGSMKTTSGISLNETQLVGEKLQQDLFITLMNFRKYKYGITADIEKMYRQVLIHESDRQYQKILWRPNEKTPVKVYKLKTVTYGQAPHWCSTLCHKSTSTMCK